MTRTAGVRKILFRGRRSGFVLRENAVDSSMTRLAGGNGRLAAQAASMNARLKLLDRICMARGTCRNRRRAWGFDGVRSAVTSQAGIRIRTKHPVNALGYSGEIGRAHV